MVYRVNWHIDKSEMGDSIIGIDWTNIWICWANSIIE